MNQNLFQVNANYGAVSDEKGNINVVSKENDTYELKDILMKENELEDLNSELSRQKIKLASNKQDTIFAETLNTILIIGEILMYNSMMASTYPLSLIFMFMGLVYIVAKCLCSCILGTRIGRYRKKKKLTTRINELEAKKPELEKELQNMKDKTKYKVSHSSLYQAEDRTRVIYPELSAPINTQVLRLTRKKKLK